MPRTEIVRSQPEIDDQLNKISESTDAGSSKYPGMTYEEGLRDMYDWLVGHTDDKPMETED